MSSFASVHGFRNSLTPDLPAVSRRLVVAPAPVVDLATLQAASGALQEQLDKDAGIIPDLGEMLTIPGRPSSGTYSVFPDDYRVPFQKRRLAAIPEEVFKFWQTTHHITHMGFLPEIERAWISIDHQLVLWDYVEGQELNTFAEQPDVISHVTLVKPKKGIFIDDIAHLLVICTPVSVILLGVQEVGATAANGHPHKDLKVYATGMTIATDVEMQSVAGTADGRIFMCGSQDGNLYELHYQEREGWFGKRIQIINHSLGGVQSLLPRFSSSTTDDRLHAVATDTQRNCIYTLSEGSVISVYRPNGEKAVQLAQTLANLFKSAQDKAPGSPALTPAAFKINSLHVVDPTESRYGIQLMAMTGNGVRMYFAPSSGAQYPYGSLNSNVASTRHLQLIHIRLPPVDLMHPDEQTGRFRSVTSNYGPAHGAQPATTRPFPISDLDNSCYSFGVTLAAQPGDSDAKDFLVCMCPDLTRIGSLGQVHQPRPEAPLYGGTTATQRPPLVEYATVLHIPGRTWAMAPVPHPAPTASPTTNELAYQFGEPSRQYMVLTSAGITFLAKRRPLDYLKDVIEEVHADGSVQSIIHFRDSFGRDQTCAMLLGVASGNTFLDIGQTSAASSISPVSSEVISTATQAFYDFGERPIWSERTTYGTGDGTGVALFSGRREGFAIYFARLVRPIWRAKITRPGSGAPELNVAEDLLVIVQRNLFALKQFLEKNPQLFHSAPSDHAGTRSVASSDQDAWRAEQKSVNQLQSLLSRTTEAISFVLLLNDYKIGELMTKCEANTQASMSTMTFEELVCTEKGLTASRALVNVVIDRQIGQQIGVDTISEVLQQRCGSFCSADDVMLYKGRENVRKAIESHNPTQRQDWLGESLRLFINAARILDFTMLREVAGDYQKLQYAKGAVELPLHCAEIGDADNQGREFWYAGCPPSDPREVAWERRRQCYELVLESLSAFDDLSAKAEPASTQSSDAQAIRNFAYEIAFSAEDEMFHSVLYEWLISRGLSDELLEMRPPFLEAYLRREPVSISKSQLLWQFYVKDGQPLRAAEVLGSLAETVQFPISLDDRIEYLTLAVGNAKSHPVAVGSRVETALAFLTDLEEKLEVAQVQLELYRILLSREGEGGDVGDRVRALQSGLFSISELYQHYADPFDLPTIKLLILHVSEHRDESLARTIWNQIFEEAINGVEADESADRIVAKVVPLGQRFYPSESAFPVRHIASLLVRFALTNKSAVAHGWASRILVQCGVPHPEIWDLFNEMYESQIPPFNEQANVQAISSDIAVFLADWVEEAARPQSGAAPDIPVARIDQAIDQYLEELEPTRTETKTTYQAVKRQLRKYW